MAGKHVLSGSSHPGNHGHGDFNQAPGDAARKIESYVSGAGRFPGGGAAGGATRTPGDESHAAVRYQNDHDWDDVAGSPRMSGNGPTA